MSWPSVQEIRLLAASARAVAEHLPLAFRPAGRRGPAGNFQGVGAGSSIDYHDHRPYLPGDDPRHLDWNAYARSGRYTLKLYRQEVSPAVDLLLDASASMSHYREKCRRALELYYLALESALRAGAALRTWSMDQQARPIDQRAALAHRLGLELAAPHLPAAPALALVAWRPRSLRVWISDLLFPGAPRPLLAHLAGGAGEALLLVPYQEEELSPPWEGHRTLVDVESGLEQRVYADSALRERHRQAYARHFALWREEARRLGVRMARVPAAPPLTASLLEEALPAGLVEPWT